MKTFQWTAALTLCAAFTGAVSAADVTIRLSHGDNPSDNPTHQTAVKFRDLVAAYTAGKVEVKIFPSNQLGSEEEVVRAVGSGTIQAQIPAMSNVHPVAPSAGIFLLPYLFSNSQEAHKGLDAMLDAVNERVIKESGIRFLGILEKGFRVLSNSRRPVEKLEDLKGLKIRVPPNKISIRTFQSWGIEPIPMGWGEVFTALQQKVIDGQENPYSTLQTSKFYEIQKYVTEVHYQIWTGPLLISERFFQSMPADQRSAVAKAGREAVAYGREQSALQEESTKKFLLDKKMVLSGAPKDEQKWRDNAQAIWPEFYSVVGGEAWAKDAIAKIQKAIGK